MIEEDIPPGLGYDDEEAGVSEGLKTDRGDPTKSHFHCTVGESVLVSWKGKSTSSLSDHLSPSSSLTSCQEFVADPADKHESKRSRNNWEVINVCSDTHTYLKEAQRFLVQRMSARKKPIERSASDAELSQILTQGVAGV